MVAIPNAIQWILMAIAFFWKCSAEKAVAKISQNLQKNTCARIFILTLEALGKEEFKGKFNLRSKDIFLLYGKQYGKCT